MCVQTYRNNCTKCGDKLQRYSTRSSTYKFSSGFSPNPSHRKLTGWEQKNNRTFNGKHEPNGELDESNDDSNDKYDESKTLRKNLKTSPENMKDLIFNY